jgi:hypothetical protein
MTLHTVLIISASGMLLYSSKTTTKLLQPRMTGSLLTALIELCVSSTGQQINYIEMTELSVSLSVDTRTGVICASFHDTRDTEDLCSIVSREHLMAFISYFQDVDFKSTAALNTNTFLSFNNRSKDIMKSCIRQVLALLCDSEKKIFHSSYITKEYAISYGDLIDEISLQANMDVFIGLSIDIRKIRSF